ncbi:MAG: hypothetical protein LBJ47_09935 [Tannerella sp.]|jgi:hypothetical protein|nr:hypothetical protein [Tannerella sp.]
MQTLKDREKNRLVKKFHILLGRYGIDEDTKKELLAQFGTTSSVHLSAAQLIELCGLVEEAGNPAIAGQDKWRKRLMAAIGAWCRATGREENAAYIKAVACRAADREHFNQIPQAVLRNLYYEFKDKQKCRDAVNAIDAERALEVICLN